MNNEDNSNESNNSTAVSPEVTAISAPESEASDKIVVIEVKNPNAEEMEVLKQEIAVGYDFSVDVKPVKFNFKKSTDKLSGIETDRRPVELAIPFPSMEGIVNILESGGKGLALLVEAMEGVVNAAARDLLADDTKLDAANFPVAKVSWESIANMPKAQRRGGGIPKETWEAFGKDYVAVMPEVTGKTIEQVANAAKILTSKLAAVKTNEPVLNLLVSQLALYVDHSEGAEEYQDCVAFLLAKADTFLNVSDEELLSAL